MHPSFPKQTYTQCNQLVLGKLFFTDHPSYLTEERMIELDYH